MNRAHTRHEWRAHFRGESAARPKGPNAQTSFDATEPVVPGNLARGAARDTTRSSSGLWIQIDHLELRGVGRVDEQHVVAALQSELKRLIAANGAPRGWGHGQVLERVQAAARPSTLTAKSLGAQLARTIYNLKGPARR